MKIAIYYDLGRKYDYFAASPHHISLAHGFLGGDYPYVKEVSDEEGGRLRKAFEEFEWAQLRLEELAKGRAPQECQCGNCPAT